MYCPFCAFEETKVIDSRLSGEGQQVRRRRECLRCGERFTTFESAELVMPRVVKSDATREPFDEAKLRSGMVKALEGYSFDGPKGKVTVRATDHALVQDMYQVKLVQTAGTWAPELIKVVPGDTVAPPEKK